MSEGKEENVIVPFWYTHFGKNVLLLLLSFVTAPISAAIVLISLAISPLTGHPKPEQQDVSTKQKTILVTGVSMTKGLTIARSLSQHTHYRIIGADISSVSPGRFSTSVAKYYQLDTPHGDDAEPYIDSILSIIQSEYVDLWISCSSVVAAVEDGQVVRLAKAAAKKGGRVFEAIQFNESVVEKFHEKDKFIEYIESLNLTVPESHRCTSAEEALAVLLPTKQSKSENESKKFILKPISVNDAARANMMTLLPLPTPSLTTTYIHSLQISSLNPFQLQQFVRGAEYCTHAIVIRGHVKAFTSCPSSELLMHYEPLPSDSRLSQEMLAFTEKVAQDGGEEFTGHLSFDFLVEDGNEDGGEVVLFPIECNPRAHTAVVLFDDTPAMAKAYMSVFDEAICDYRDSRGPVYPVERTKSYYWFGHDLVTLGILPVLDALGGRRSWVDVRDGVGALAKHIIYWRDGTWTLADPVPFFVLYHLYWPMKFVESLRAGKRWSRINVSTTKMFDG